MNKVDEFIKIFKRRLTRFTPTGVDYDSYCLDEMILAQQRLERDVTLPWFLLKYKSDAVLNTGSINTETGFLRFAEEFTSIRLIDSDNNIHYPVLERYGAAEAAYPPETTDPGEPKYVAELNNKMYFFPAADASNSFTLKYWYYAADTVLAEGGDANLWLTYYPDLLIAEAGVVIATTYIKNQAASSAFATMLMQEKNRMKIDNRIRLETMVDATARD